VDDARSPLVHHQCPSAQEVEAILFIAEDLQYITAEVCEGLRKSANEIGRMLNGLARYYAKT
jgi:four helix bundle protein